MIGASLFIYVNYAPVPLRTAFDDWEVIPANYYWRFENEVDFGVNVCSEYSASEEIEFFILDSENFNSFLEKYKEGERYTFFSAIYHSFGASDSFTFRAPRDDIYYTILLNDGDTDVSASFKQLEEAYTILGGIAFGSLVFLAIGIVALIIGLLQKSKPLPSKAV